MTAVPEVSTTARWTTTRRQGTTEILTTAAEFAYWRPHYERWATSRDLATTGTSCWLFADVGLGGSVAPWAVVSTDPDGILDGMLTLLDENMNGQTVTTLAGADQGHRGVIAAASPEVAESLAEVVGAVLRSRVELSRLLLGPLDANDASVHAFASALPGAQLMADAPIPVITRETPDAEDYLSHNMRRTLRKGRNRVARDGHDLSVAFTTDATEIAAMVPLLEECHIARDHAHGRPSDLDDERARRLWHARLAGLSAAGRLELSVLRIDGQFAAHALGVTDGSVYRVLEGRFVTDWSRYAPGRLLEAAVLQRVLDDASLSTLDWMTAVAPEKLLATNGADPMVLVHWVPGL